MGTFTVQGGAGILNNPEYKAVGVKSSAHRQIHMRNDSPLFKDKRVRQALALSLDRDVLVRGLFKGRAQIGNDSPFAPVFPSSDAGVPQRKIDVAKAKQLLAQAGVPNGFDVTLTTEKYMEIPDLAVVVQNAAKAIGVRINLKVESQSLYYGAGTPGKSDWLDSPLGITDYGHRGVPNVFLNAPLTSTGTWNAAHFKNPQYDQLVAQFVAARRPRLAEETLRADPDATARRNAGDHSVLLRSADRHAQGCERRALHRARATLFRSRGVERVTVATNQGPRRFGRRSRCRPR